MFDLPMAARGMAHWLIKNHLDCFDHDAREWFQKTNSPTRLLVYGLDRALLRYWLWTTFSDAPEETFAFLRYAVGVTRELFINQRQLRGDICEGFHDGHFWQSPFTRLLRGHVNCEGQNHVLAILLKQRFNDVCLFETMEPGKRRARHSLVVFSFEGRRVFADAWSDVPLLHVHRDWPNAPTEIANIDDLEARNYGERQGIDQRVMYEAGRVVPMTVQRPWTVQLIRDWNAPQPVAGTLRPRENGFVEYLGARVQHVLGSRDEALRLYREVAQKYPGMPTGRAAALFAERLNKGRP